jgi:ACS family hexuronate transporter-like MFS transporter
MSLNRLRWLILGLLCASTVINYIDRLALAVLLPQLRQELGITSAQYGEITTAFMVAYTLAQVAGGMVIDRLGTRTGFLLFVAAWSLAASGHALASSATSLLFLRFLLGLSEAGNWPAGGKAIAEWFPQHRRAFAMGVFDGGSALGAILAQPVVAMLALRFGWRAAFLLTGALGFVWVAGWWVVYRRPEAHPWLSESERRIVRAETSAASNAARRGLFADLKPMVRSRQLWALMLTRLLATPVWWFYAFWLPDLLAREHGFSLKEIGLFGWIPFLTVDLGKLGGGALSDRLLVSGYSATWARKSVMALGAFCMISAIQVNTAQSAAVALGWISVATFGFGLWSANILALHADIFSSRSMATAVGCTGTAASLGGAIFTFLTGRIVQVSGYATMFWITAAVTAMALMSLIFALGKVQPVRLAEVTEQ